MTTGTLPDALRETLMAFALPENEIVGRLSAVRDEVLKRSEHLREGNFTSIHRRDLRLLFEIYDKWFFESRCGRAVNPDQLRFRLSTRMTKAGGATTRFESPSGVHYEIAIACGLLFDCFRNHDGRDLRVAGLPCTSRLDALLRIFEHELVHLTEQVCWGNSNCARTRFQEIASRHFLHRTHTHELITRQERAAVAGLLVGTSVEFVFEGRKLVGRINRVTKRITVLVEDPLGQPYSNNRRYQKFYVPIEQLRAVNITE